MASPPPPHASRPRKVSFSDILPSGLSLGMSMTGLGASTSSTSSAISSSSSTSSDASKAKTKARRPPSPCPPKIRPAPSPLPTSVPSTPPKSSTRPYMRSPYVPTHVRADSAGGDTDVFAESPPGWKASPGLRFKAMGSVPADADDSDADDGANDKENRAVKWGVPRSPTLDAPSPSHSPSPSPGNKKSNLPRLDFSRTSTPLTARKLFTPRRLLPQPESPTRTLGRKISLHGLGAAFAEKETPPRPGLINFKSVARDEGQQHDDENESEDGESSFGDDEEADADAVDLALDLAGLSMSSRPSLPTTPSHVAPSDVFDGPFTPDVSGVDRSGDDHIIHDKSVDLSFPSPPHSALESPQVDTPVSHRSSAPTSPPTKIPSVPSTPAGVTGYGSDDSEVFVPRTRRAAPTARRIIDSDDEEAVVKPRKAPISRRIVGSDDEDVVPPPQVSKAKGLRGRVPAAIQRLNVSESEEDAQQYFDVETQDDDKMSSDGSYDEANDTLGSMADFIAPDDEDVEQSELSELEAEESYERGAVSEPESDDEPSRPRPRLSEVWVRRRDYDSNESLGLIRDFVEPDANTSVVSSASYIPSQSSRPSRPSECQTVSEGRKIQKDNVTEIIEFLDSSDEEDEGASGSQNDDVELLADGTEDEGEDRGESEGESEGDDKDEDEDEEDDGILHFSPPPRPIQLPDLGGLKLHDSDEDDHPTTNVKAPPKRPLSNNTTVINKTKPRPATKTSAMSKKEWEVYRVKVAQELFDDLDRAVFERRLGKDGVRATLEWSPHLRTSAGNANRKRVRNPDGSTTMTYCIKLSVKVLTTKEQIIDTVAHEMCHLAAWVISNELKNPHGRVFKSWGAKVMQARPDIEVTTKHSYEIPFKYSWQCTNPACAKVISRHSKSFDTSRLVCGACRSKFAPCFETKTATAFQTYLKDNMKAAKAAMPSASHGDVMRALSKRWSEEPEGDHVAYWRSIGSVAA